MKDHPPGRFGAHAIDSSMRRAGVAPPRRMRWLSCLDPRRAARAMSRRGLTGAAALVLSALACYGTLVATAALSLAGITLAVNPGAVSATILGFAAVARAAIGAGVRKHGRLAPLAPALAGGAVLLYAHLVEFSFAVELAGFVVLGLAVALDLRARRRLGA
jgi:hypothetical protein